MFASSLSSLIRFYNLLTEPHPSIEARDQRRQARLLASVAAFILILGAIFQFILVPLFTESGQPTSWVSVVAIFGTMFVAYAFSRTRYFTMGALITISGFSIAVVLPSLIEPDTADTRNWVFLILPVLLSSVFLSLRGTALIGLAHLVLILLLSLSSSLNPLRDSPFILFLISDGVILFAMHYRNILELDRQQELIESKELYQTLSETVFEGTVILENGIIQQANSGFALIFDHSVPALEGLPFIDFVPHWESRSADHQYEQATDFTGIRRDGTEVELEIVSSPQTVNGRPVEIVAVRDISERRRAEETLREAQRLDSLGVLTGGIAHDFNNMLTGILAQTSLAVAKLDADDVATTHVHKAMKSAARAADLTKQLLVYAGNASFEAKNLELNQFVSESLSLIEATLPITVTLQKEISSEQLWIDADHGQMQQVILNLVLNGAQAIFAERGTVTIKTEITILDEENAHPLAYGQKPLPFGEYIKMTITDTGIGMDNKTLLRIFDPFFTTKESGHGLGLSSILGIVRKHRGAILVDSELGRGTIFTVLIPSGHSAPAIVPEPVRTIPSEQRGASLVLVVDDEQPIRECVEDILHLAGIRVITADNGHDGVEKFKELQSEIDLAIVDYKMPIMNGEETLRALRVISPTLKIIFSSGHGEEEVIKRIKRTGVTDFLQKPYDLDMLVDKVQAVL